MVNISLMVNPITMDIMATIENMDKIIDQEPQVRVAGLRALGSICCVLEGIRSSICLSKKKEITKLDDENVIFKKKKR